MPQAANTQAVFLLNYQHSITRRVSHHLANTNSLCHLSCSNLCSWGCMLWCNKLGCCVGTHILWQSAWDGVLPVFLIQLSGDAHSGRQQVMVTQVLGHLSPSWVGGSSSWLWPGLFLAIVGIASFTNQKILYWVFSLSLFLTLSLLPSPPLQINKWLSKALLLNILERSFAEIILCSQCLPIAAF